MGKRESALRWGGLLVALLWLGCRWEGDEVLKPATQVAYLLSRDAEGSHILRHAGDTLTLDWQRSLGLRAAKTGGLDGHQGSLWLSAAQQLMQLSPAGELLRSYDLDSRTGHYLQAGDRTLLLCDTAQAQIGFFDFRRETLAWRPLDSVSGQPRYKGGQFYLPAGHSVWVYQERAYAPLAQVRLAQRVVDLQPDQRFGVEVYTGSRDSLLAATLDYNQHRLVEEEAFIPQRKERLSPYRQAYYGQELTRSVALNRAGRIFGFSNIIDFEYDFFQRVLYLQKADSVLIYRQLATQKQAVAAELGRWVHAWYHVSSVVD